MKKLILPIILTFLLFKFASPVRAANPHFFLSPTSGSQNGSFNTEIRIDSGGQAAGGADVYLSYPQTLIVIDNFTPASGVEAAFTEVYSSIKNDEGKLRVYGYFPSSQAEKFFNGANGFLGTIRFRSVSSGTAAVSFICNLKADGTNEGNDSNISLKSAPSDIIVCTANVGASYSVSPASGSATATPTPTPTTAAGTTRTPTPTIPTTGIVEDTIGLLGLGAIILLTGLAFSL